MEFTALEDFFCPETQSQYSKGLSYTFRPAEAYALDAMPERQAQAIRARCKALNELLPQWIRQGKVMPGRPSSGVVRGG